MKIPDPVEIALLLMIAFYCREAWHVLRILIRAIKAELTRFKGRWRDVSGYKAKVGLITGTTLRAAGSTILVIVVCGPVMYHVLEAWKLFVSGHIA